MKPESAAFVRKADIMLDRATRMLAGELYEDAARSAYLACFHVAQALIFEHTERVNKSHNGVQSEFNRLIRGDARVDDTLRKFSSRVYEFNSVADYGTGPEAIVPRRDAEALVETANEFVTHIGGARAKARVFSRGRPFKLLPKRRQEAPKRCAAGETLAEIARTDNVSPAIASSLPQ